MIQFQWQVVRNLGNDTIDRYPLGCGEIAKILCVKESVFKRIQREFRAFLKANRPPCAPKPIIKPKVKIKPSNKTILPQSHFEPSNFSDSLNLCRNHKKSRMNDWYNTYGQGMYE